MLHRNLIIHALNRLSELLKEINETRTLIVVGGAAIELLGFNRPDVTRDVDVISNIDKILARLILQIAQEMGLPNDWLNNHSSIFLNNIDTKSFPSETEVYQSNNLKVYSVAIDLLIELKVRAYVDRGLDDNDLVILAPPQATLLAIKEKLLREGNHNQSNIELDFAEIFNLLGYEK